MSSSRYHRQEVDGQLLRTITDEIMQAIAKLSGQEYVDIDARRAKAELAADGQGGKESGIWVMLPGLAAARDG